MECGSLQIEILQRMDPDLYQRPLKSEDARLRYGLNQGVF